MCAGDQRQNGLTILNVSSFWQEIARGALDVGARADIYRLLENLASEGVAILIVSSDVEEDLRISDRVIVMSRGSVVREFSSHELTQAALTKAASAAAA